MRKGYGTFMLSLEHLIGGIVLIKHDNKIVAWIDIYNDLVFAECVCSELKSSITSFLTASKITYNQ